MKNYFALRLSMGLDFLIAMLQWCMSEISGIVKVGEIDLQLKYCESLQHIVNSLRNGEKGISFYLWIEKEDHLEQLIDGLVRFGKLDILVSLTQLFPSRSNIIFIKCTEHGNGLLAENIARSMDFSVLMTAVEYLSEKQQIDGRVESKVLWVLIDKLIPLGNILLIERLCVKNIVQWETILEECIWSGANSFFQELVDIAPTSKLKQYLSTIANSKFKDIVKMVLQRRSIISDADSSARIGYRDQFSSRIENEKRNDKGMGLI